MKTAVQGLFQKAAEWCAVGRGSGCLRCALAFSPALAAAVLIAGHAVNIPVWDGWERGVLIEKARSGSLDMAYLSSAHIDHRPIVPRVLTLASNSLTRGDVRVEMWIGFLAVVAGAVGLLLVLRKTLPSPAWFWTTAFLVNVILFSPLQYQNFLWAVQMAFLLPLGCFGLLLAVMNSGWRLPWKFLAAVVLAELGTFSFGHGLVLWPVAICFALMAREFAPIGKRWVFAGCLVVVAAATLWAYIGWNYVNTSQPPHAYGAMPGEAPPAVNRLDNIAERPERVQDYFWSSLGNPLARLFGSDPAAVSVSVGRTCFWMFIVLLAWMLWRWRDDEHWRALLPWAAVGMFSIVVAALLASGRGSYLPFERSLLSRYLSLTMYLPVAIVVFGSYLLHHYRARGAALVLASLFVASHWQLWIYGAHKMDAWQSARLQQRFQLLYARHVEPRTPTLFDSQSIMGWKDGEPPFAIGHAMYLDEEGLMHPPMFEEKDFGSFAKSAARALIKGSDISLALAQSSDALFLRGFASLDDGRAADGVIAAWRPVRGGSVAEVLVEDRSKEKGYGEGLAAADWELIDLIEVAAAPAMRASFYDGQFGANPRNLSKRKNWARFEHVLDVTALPMGVKVEIVLWVADTKRMELRPMKRSLRLKRADLEAGQVLIEEK